MKAQNGNKASIREVYNLLEDFRKENQEQHKGILNQTNQRIDDLENNHLVHLDEKVDNIQNKIYFLLGGLAVLEIILRIFLKL